MKEYKPNKYAEEAEERALRTSEEDKKSPKSLEEVIRQQKAADLRFQEKLKKSDAGRK